jgi:uncharacterized protein
MTDRELASVLGVSGERGRKFSGYLNVADHPDGSPEKLPFVLLNGKERGPCLWLTACEHGDEVLAAASVIEFMAGLDPRKVKGQVVAFPVIASPAFNIKYRYSPGDSFDFSRAWPGFANGALAQHVASILMELMVEQADYVINVHDGLPGRLMPTPYIIATYDTPDQWETTFRGFTESLLLEKIVHWIGRSTERGARTATMMAALWRAGVPSVVPEVGPNTKEGLAAGINGYRNAMRFLGMLPGTPERLPSYRAFPDVVHVFPSRGGVFTSLVELEEEVKEGQVLATIRNFDGTITERLVSPADGIIIAKWILPMIGTGDFSAFEVATFAEFKKSWPGER